MAQNSEMARLRMEERRAKAEAEDRMHEIRHLRGLLKEREWKKAYRERDTKQLEREWKMHEKRAMETSTPTSPSSVASSEVRPRSASLRPRSPSSPRPRRAPEVAAEVGEHWLSLAQRGAPEAPGSSTAREVGGNASSRGRATSPGPTSPGPAIARSRSASRAVGAVGGRSRPRTAPLSGGASPGGRAPSGLEDAMLRRAGVVQRRARNSSPRSSRGTSPAGPASPGGRSPKAASSSQGLQGAAIQGASSSQGGSGSPPHSPQADGEPDKPTTRASSIAPVGSGEGPTSASDVAAVPNTRRRNSFSGRGSTRSRRQERKDRFNPDLEDAMFRRANSQWS